MSSLSPDDVNDVSHDLFILHCKAGKLAEVKEDLLINKAYIHYQDDEGLQQAVKSGNLELVKYLVESPELTDHADISASSGSAPYNAAINGSIEILYYLLQHYNPYPELVKSMLYGATINNKIATLEYYKDTNPDDFFKSENIETILKTAIKYHHINILQWATNNNIDYTPHYPELFRFALEDAVEKALQYLIVEKQMPCTDKIKQLLQKADSQPGAKNIVEYASHLFDTVQLYNDMQSEIKITSKKVNNKKI